MTKKPIQFWLLNKPRAERPKNLATFSKPSRDEVGGYGTGPVENPSFGRFAPGCLWAGHHTGTHGTPVNWDGDATVPPGFLAEPLVYGVSPVLTFRIPG